MSRSPRPLVRPADRRASSPAVGRGLAAACAQLAASMLLTACTTSEPGNSTAASLSQAASLAAVCSGCHRISETGSAIASLTGYSAEQLATLMRTYKNNSEGPSAMHRMARGYSDAQIEQIARYLEQHSEQDQ